MVSKISMLPTLDFGYVILWNMNYRYWKNQFSSIFHRIWPIFELFLPAYIGPLDAERRQSLGQLHAWSLLLFQSGKINERVGLLKFSLKINGPILISIFSIFFVGKNEVGLTNEDFFLEKFEVSCITFSLNYNRQQIIIKYMTWKLQSYNK